MVISCLDFLISVLESIMEGTQNLEHNIIMAKEDASDAYRKASSMEACLEGWLVEVDRKECLSRLLCLLQAADSTHLAWGKNLIYHEEQERQDLEPVI
jgi:hypothetical protein